MKSQYSLYRSKSWSNIQSVTFVEFYNVEKAPDQEVDNASIVKIAELLHDVLIKGN